MDLYSWQKNFRPMRWKLKLPPSNQVVQQKPAYNYFEIYWNLNITRLTPDNFTVIHDEREIILKILFWSEKRYWTVGLLGSKYVMLPEALTV